MPRNNRSEHTMVSLILLTGTLLLVSLLSLGEQVLTANSAEAGEEPYPNLYAEPPAGYSEPEQKTVYLTFDDGPSPNTEVLLDWLREEDLHATFFVCAQWEDTEFMERMLRRMRDEGHTIGLHSYTHDVGEIYTSLEDYLEDLNRINEFIHSATGLYPAIVRFPGGSATRNCDPELMRRIAQEVTRRGYVFYDWTVPSGDDGPTAAPPEDIAGRILSGVGDRQVEIILCHDNNTPSTTPAAVAQVVGPLREQGYAFDRITHTVPPVQLFNGYSD